MAPAYRPRILVIDDDPDALDAIVDLLDNEGFAVERAHDIDSAVKLAERLDFELILSDVHLRSEAPFIDGLTRLRASAPAVPMGLMSASVIDEKWVRPLALSFTMRKPFAIEEMLRLVAEATHAPPPSDEQRRVIEQYFKCLESLDLQRLGGLCTEDIEYILPGDDAQLSRTVKGRDAFLDFTRRTFAQFQMSRFEVMNVITLPRAIVARFKGSWQAANTRPELLGSVLFQLRDGRISNVGVRVDTHAINKA